MDGVNIEIYKTLSGTKERKGHGKEKQMAESEGTALTLRDINLL